MVHFSKHVSKLKGKKFVVTIQHLKSQGKMRCTVFKHPSWEFLGSPWLRLGGFTAMGLGLIPGRRTKIPKAMRHASLPPPPHPKNPPWIPNLPSDSPGVALLFEHLLHQCIFSDSTFAVSLFSCWGTLWDIGDTKVSSETDNHCNKWTWNREMKKMPDVDISVLMTPFVSKFYSTLPNSPQAPKE